MRAIIQLGVSLIETALHGAEALAERISDPEVQAEAKHALATIHAAADTAFATLQASCPAAMSGVTLRSGGTGKDAAAPPPAGDESDEA